MNEFFRELGFNGFVSTPVSDLMIKDQEKENRMIEVINYIEDKEKNCLKE